MRNFKKVFLFLAVLLMALIFSPSFSNAATTTADSETALREQIDSANDGDIIELSTNIELTSPIEITGKNITIDGKGNTITKSSSTWSTSSANGSLITAGSEGTRLKLSNLNLTNAQKYGAQAYNGGYLIVDNVTISDCGYGGIMINAGTLEIQNLTLNRNGSSVNNGIELGKGFSVPTGDNIPTIVMNGTLHSTETENVIRVAVNDAITGFDVVNDEGTTDKIFINDNKIVVTDPQNNILYSSPDIGEIEFSGEPYVANVTISVHLNDKIVEFTIMGGTTLTKEDLISKINLEELGLNDYTLDGFYTDNEYTTEFDFATPFVANTTLYGKLTLKNAETEKDDTPKTGTDNSFGLALLVLIVSVFAVAVLKREV